MEFIKLKGEVYLNIQHSIYLMESFGKQQQMNNKFCLLRVQAKTFSLVCKSFSLSVQNQKN